ncbi:MAG: hypothetical protein M0D57_20920 [Sphingobacteriales bacterium JAD_PAG50586_3]|nr:MAG: hypothetical protein M0D57_20920 [Sphingobacteriales bacterium JAD_PAG50586_3]
MGRTEGQQAHFVLVDDDEVSNILAKSIIKRHFPSAGFTIFTAPEDALLFLEKFQCPLLYCLI